MPEMPSRESGFTYSACESFTINKKISKKLKKHEIHDTFIKTN